MKKTKEEQTILAKVKEWKVTQIIIGILTVALTYVIGFNRGLTKRISRYY